MVCPAQTLGGALYYESSVFSITSTCPVICTIWKPTTPLKVGRMWREGVWWELDRGQSSSHLNLVIRSAMSCCLSNLAVSMVNASLALHRSRRWSTRYWSSVPQSRCKSTSQLVAWKQYANTCHWLIDLATMVVHDSKIMVMVKIEQSIV